MDLTAFQLPKRNEFATKSSRVPFTPREEAVEDQDEDLNEVEKREQRQLQKLGKQFRKGHWQIDKFSHSPEDFIYSASEADQIYNERVARGEIDLDAESKVQKID